MLGRHVYRVHAGEDGRWSITKEGEPSPRANYSGRELAVAEACRLAESDKPSRVLIDNGDGTLAEERLFGSEYRTEEDRAL